jgi:hypothetical protein
MARWRVLAALGAVAIAGCSPGAPGQAGAPGAAAPNAGLPGGPAEDGSWTGEWRGQSPVATGAMMVVDLVVQPSGAFSETEQGGPIMTMQTGQMSAAGAGEVSFVVQDWQPRSMPVYHAVGTQGGYYTQEQTSAPPGGTWRYRFNGPNSVTLQDVNMGGAITLTRVR